MNLLDNLNDQQKARLITCHVIVRNPYLGIDQVPDYVQKMLELLWRKDIRDERKLDILNGKFPVSYTPDGYPTW